MRKSLRRVPCTHQNKHQLNGFCALALKMFMAKVKAS